MDMAAMVVVFVFVLFFVCARGVDVVLVFVVHA